MKSHIVMIFNGLILIILGLYGYITADTKSLTAFIGPAVGLIFIILSFPVKKENSIAAHITVGLTFVSTFVFLYAGIKRENSIVIISAVTTFICLIFYIADFAARKKERAKNSGNEK